MKVFGIISKEKLTESAVEKSAKLMHRQPKEKFGKFVRDDALIFLITQDKEYIVSSDFALQVVDRNGRQFKYCESNRTVRFIKMDKMGLSKLYYYVDGDDLVFSSEMKSIIFYIGLDNFTLNQFFIDSMLVYGYPTDDTTLFKEIKNLVPARFIYHADGKTRLKSYDETGWLFTHHRRHDSRLLMQLLEDKIVPHKLIEEHSLVWLSGGLDSRIIFKYLSDARPINTIVNFGYKGSTERKYAKKYAYKNNVVNLTTYEITPEIIVQNYLDYMWINEGLSGHLNSHIQWFLNRFKDTEKLVIYDGYAGDAILGGNGYDKCKPSLLLKPYVNAPYMIQKEYHQLQPYTYLNDYARNITASGGIKTGREYGTVIYPFADHTFYSWCMNVPIDRRRKHKFFKKVVRHTIPDVLRVPSTSLQAQSLIRRGLQKYVIKKKHPYIRPAEWIRENEEYHEMLYYVLTDKDTEKRDVFRVDKIHEMFRHHMQRKADYSGVLAKLFNLEIMFRQLLDGDKP